MTAVLAKAADDQWLARFGKAVADDLRDLARLHDREPDPALLEALREVSFPDHLGLQLRSERGREALRVMRQAIAELPQPPDAEVLDRLAVDFAEIYLTYGLRASPSESVWLDHEGLERQQPMFQVRRWYHRHGLAAADWRARADDHLVLQLSFLAHLLSQAAKPGALGAAATFADEHLLRWLDQFAARVASRCATPFFAGVALLTAAYVDELRDILAASLGEPRPTADEIEARMRPKVTASCGPTRYVPGVGPGW